MHLHHSEDLQKERELNQQLQSKIQQYEAQLYKLNTQQQPIISELEKKLKMLINENDKVNSECIQLRSTL